MADPAATGSRAEAAAAAAAMEEGRKLKVMIGMDDSEESFYALNWALSNLLSQDGRCLVYLLHVQQPFQSYVFPAGPGLLYPPATTTVMESVRKAQAEIAEALFGRAMKICKEKQVRSETLILEGSPKEMICQAAEQMHVDMLVLGSRGLGQIKRAFLGSVSDYCAHHATCPVLIVKPPPRKYK